MSEETWNCCSATSSLSGSTPTQLKIHRAFLLSVPISLALFLFLLFCILCLRRPRVVQWVSLPLPLRTPTASGNGNGGPLSAPERGLRKELREMLPIIVYKESFSVHDTQCAVCLGDYEVEDRLQQIPSCGHSFHMDCIDHWLANHTTCPLCRVSLLAPKIRTPETQIGSTCETSDRDGLQAHEETDNIEAYVARLGDRVSENHLDAESNFHTVGHGRESVHPSNVCGEHL